MGHPLWWLNRRWKSMGGPPSPRHPVEPYSASGRAPFALHSCNLRWAAYPFHKRLHGQAITRQFITISVIMQDEDVLKKVVDQDVTACSFPGRLDQRKVH